MTIFEFGDAKLKLNDIDPLYFALWRAGLSLGIRQRFTLAEVMFDHAGLAASIAEAKNFYSACERAAQKTLRGAPRRYFRGAVATNAIRALWMRFRTAESTLASLRGTFTEVNTFIQNTFPQFGPCAAFKLADMAERVCENKIDFSQATAEEICNSKQVRKGFDKAWTVLGISAEELLPAMRNYRWVTKASPRFDRPLNAQEFESMLCYYSHDDGHKGHRPGEDREGIAKELEGWGPLSEKLRRFLP